jgi:isopenicillin-N N-acyltransferase like protein
MITAVPFVREGFPADLVVKSRTFLAETLAMFPRSPFVKAAIEHLFARYPGHAERATRIARLMGVEPLDLFAGNLSYDLFMGSGGMGCSTMALPTPEGPMLARNMDWPPADKIARASCLVAEDFGINAGFLGLIGAVTAQSRKGFAICLNAVPGVPDPEGYPMLLFLRDVLDTAEDYDEALARVQRERLMSGGIITLVGTANHQRAIVERTATKAAVRTARDDGLLLATNHYRVFASRPEYCSRYAYLAATAGKVPPLEILTNPEVLQSITAQHVIFQPATGRAEMYVPTDLLG